MTEHQQRVQSVVIAHEILQALGNEAGAVSLATLARTVNMTPTRVLRHLTTLLDLGLVEREEGNEPVYRLGSGLVQLAERATSQQDVVRKAYPVLSAVQQKLGQATFLVRPQRNHAVIWLSFQSDDIPHLTMPPGMVFSMSGSACGRAMLAFMDPQPMETAWPDEVSSLYPDPVKSPAELERRLRDIRTRFYDLYGTQGVLFGLGAPILDHREKAVAALGLVGFSVNLRDKQPLILETILKAAAEISSGLGSRCAWPSLELGEGHSSRTKPPKTHLSKRA